ncbi:ribbon-helix-helix domain-containing protein [Nocardioides rotundus]|uniref:ribbon-helix-helix domain-containing protein n=1 Tax=Nocardioides rotundus TaxID=1774216 RepID=UPI001CBBAABC|nr:ribbon-helix-helix domain-containing protein [Nocardioides rotundus]UAL30682.1 ribbon-helix-helix domain-containing protein [Nocardioides rotundus]
MKLSVSLSEEDVAALDRFVEQTGLDSRSAGIQQAIRRLRGPELAAAYAAAFEEWEDASDAAAWEATTADGLD